MPRATRNEERETSHSSLSDRRSARNCTSMPGTKTSALILFAHGAREPGWAEPFRTMRDKVAASRPDLSVELAFLELMSPALGDCVDGLAAAGHERVTVAPLFLAMGGHLKEDLPRLLD